jgi:hypothetical protein
MVPLELARRLREAGLAWKPAPGDWFAVPDRGMDDEYFVLSDMTIQVYDVPEGTLIGFNGTTEWALDDLDKDEAVWLPREDQLRDLLGAAFLGLTRRDDGDYGEGGEFIVTTVDGGFRAASAAGAYGQALLHLLTAGPGGYPGGHV